MKRPTLSMKDIHETLTDTSRVSPLGKWLEANKVEFAAALKATRPNWSGLVQRFAQAGLMELPSDFQTDPMVRRQVTKRAKQVWLRVQRRKVRAPAPPAKPV